MHRASTTLTGILLMIVAMASFAAMSTLIRLSATHMHSAQIVLLRNAFSLGLILLWIAARRQRGVWRTQRFTGHFWRGAIGFLAMETWFYCLSRMPLTVATALSFTTPVFATAFAVLCLKEQAGPRRWAAIALSFAGVLVILRPGPESFQASALLVLLSSALMAITGITVKSLTRTESSETIVLYMALIMLPMSAPFGLAHWQPVSVPLLGVALLIAFFSTASHLLLARAYTKAPLVTLLPFDFTRLIFTGIFAHFAFNEHPDAMTYLGAAIILASTVYMAHREAVRKEKV